MKSTLVFTFLCMVACSFACRSRSPRSDLMDGPAVNPKFSDLLNTNSLKIYQAMLKVRAHADPRTGNELISPLSAMLNIGMLRQGVGDDLAAEIDLALGLDDQSLPRLIEYIKTFEKSGDDNSFKISFANRLWFKGLKVKKSFQSAINLKLPAAVQVLAADDPEAVKTTINSWVAKRTNGELTDFYNPSSRENAPLIVTDSVYISGQWLNEFLEPSENGLGKFVLDDQTKADVVMLQQGFRSKYGFYSNKEKGFKALEIKTAQDQANHSLSMVILVPLKTKTLADVEAALTPELLKAVLKKTSVPKVDIKVELPKWSLTTSSYDFKEIYAEAGLKSLLAPETDFVNMLDEETIQKDAWPLIQKTFIAVNELGFEVEGAGSSIAQRGLGTVFSVNRPFMYLIKDNRTNAILLMGRVMDPSKTGI